MLEHGYTVHQHDWGFVVVRDSDARSGAILGEMQSSLPQMNMLCVAAGSMQSRLPSMDTAAECALVAYVLSHVGLA